MIKVRQVRKDLSTVGSFLSVLRFHAKDAEQRFWGNLRFFVSCLIGTVVYILLFSAGLYFSMDWVFESMAALLVPYALLSLLALIGIPVAGFCLVAAINEIRYRRAFKEELRQMEWARIIPFPEKCREALIVPRFSGNTVALNRFRLVFLGLLRDHVEEDEKLMSTINKLRNLKACQQWRQLEARDFDLFTYDEMDSSWKISGQLMDSDLASSMMRLFTSMTYLFEGDDEESLTTKAWVFDHEGETAALATLAEAVRDSDYHDIEDFLELATSPIRFIGTTASSMINHGPVQMVHIGEISKMRVAYWESETDKLREAQKQDFELHTELITKMVNSEVEESFAHMVR